MSFRSWLHVFALAITLATSGQVWGQSVAEVQPQQEEGATDPQGNNEEPESLLPALANIEAAIRDLIAEEDKIEADAQQVRESRDLNAQEGMAWWAELMFYAAAATVVLTLAALLAIIRTLHHTHRAANYTEGMLKEAKNTTKSAQSAVEVAREIGESQVRAYVRITGGSVKLVRADPRMTDQRVRPQITIKVRNYGQSPAMSFQWSVITRYYPPMQGEFLGSNGFPPESWGKDIGCDEEPSFNSNLGSAPLDESAMQTLTSTAFHMDFVIRYVFRDVFKNQIEDERVFTAFVPMNGIDVETPLIPHVLDKETIDRLIEANSPENIALMDEAMRKSEQDDSK